MTKVSYLTKNGNVVKTFMEAVNDGGIATTIYEPIPEKLNVSAKQLTNRVKINN